MTSKSDSLWRRRRFEIALAVAALGHVGLLSRTPAELETASRRALEGASLEIEVLSWVDARDEPPAHLGAAAAADGPGRAMVSLPAGATAQPTFEPEELAPDAASEPLAPMEETSAEFQPLPAAPGAEQAAAPRPRVTLFLGQSDLAELSRRNPRKAREVAPAPEAPRASVGLLSEGLQALDAEKGLSGSSPAVSASYRAARLGPSVGTAVFEIRTDARGAVTSVKLIGDAGNGPWLSVAADLLARLKDRLLRLPEGAKGLVTRLRIDRGELAQDLSERGKTKRGVAIGQDHHPKDLGWDESTQGSSRPSRLAPSLGVSSDDLRTSIKTRVRLLSQQSL